MPALWISLGAAIGLLVGAVAVYFVLSSRAKSLVGQAKTEADRIRETSRKEADTLAKEVALSARQEQIRLKEAFDADANLE